MPRRKKAKDPKLVALAQEIKRYLRAHPRAADTVEGIAKWWLARQRYEEALKRVRDALDLLVEQGVVTKRIVAGGKVVYFSGRGKVCGENKN